MGRSCAWRCAWRVHAGRAGCAGGRSGRARRAGRSTGGGHGGRRPGRAGDVTCGSSRGDGLVSVKLTGYITVLVVVTVAMFCAIPVCEWVGRERAPGARERAYPHHAGGSRRDGGHVSMRLNGYIIELVVVTVMLCIILERAPGRKRAYTRHAGGIGRCVGRVSVSRRMYYRIRRFDCRACVHHGHGHGDCYVLYRTST